MKMPLTSLVNIFLREIDVYKRQAEGGTVTLTDTPASGAAVNVFAADDDCGTAKTATVANKTVTITGAAAGDKVIVYYVKDITDKVQKISVKGSSFPKTFTVYGDTVMKTESDELLPYKFIAYKVTPPVSYTHLDVYKRQTIHSGKKHFTSGFSPCVLNFPPAVS